MHAGAGGGPGPGSRSRSHSPDHSPRGTRRGHTRPSRNPRDRSRPGNSRRDRTPHRTRRGAQLDVVRSHGSCPCRGASDRHLPAPSCLGRARSPSSRAPHRRSRRTDCDRTALSRIHPPCASHLHGDGRYGDHHDGGRHDGGRRGDGRHGDVRYDDRHDVRHGDGCHGGRLGDGRQGAYRGSGCGVLRGRCCVETAVVWLRST